MVFDAQGRPIACDGAPVVETHDKDKCIRGCESSLGTENCGGPSFNDCWFGVGNEDGVWVGQWDVTVDCLVDRRNESARPGSTWCPAELARDTSTCAGRCGDACMADAVTCAMPCSTMLFDCLIQHSRANLGAETTENPQQIIDACRPSFFACRSGCGLPDSFGIDILGVPP